MIDIRRADTRFHTEIDWLDSWHSFSFGNHYDPTNTHHGLLLVLNDDVIAPGGGFGTHPHRDMEIVTWVLDGALEHRDSEGNHGVISPGLAQRMSAGRGIRHSEVNASTTEPVHLLQMWVPPDTTRHHARLRAARRQRRHEGRRAVPARVGPRDRTPRSASTERDATLVGRAPLARRHGHRARRAVRARVRRDRNRRARRHRRRSTRATRSASPTPARCTSPAAADGAHRRDLGDVGRSRRLLDEPRQAAVGEHLAAGLTRAGSTRPRATRTTRASGRRRTRGTAGRPCRAR